MDVASHKRVLLGMPYFLHTFPFADAFHRFSITVQAESSQIFWGALKMVCLVEGGQGLCREQKKIPRTQPVYLTVAEVAILLGVCRQTIYNMIDREGLPTITIRGIRRIDPKELDTWLLKYRSGSSI